MIRGKINTWMLLGYQLGPVTVGYRREWKAIPFYRVYNVNEQSVYGGLGPLYLRFRWSGK